MSLEEIRTQFPRIEAKWPQGGQARYLKTLSTGWDDQEFAGFEETLRRFAAGDDDPKVKPLMVAADRAARVYSRYRLQHVRDALSQAEGWRQGAERSAVWGALVCRLEAEVNFNTRRTAPTSYVPIWADFVGAVANTAHLLALGWDELAAAKTRLLLRMLRGQCFHVPTDKFVTQHFVLRLLADWQGISSHWTWPKASRKEPLFERILALWREPAAAGELGYLLAVACDRHLLQSSTSDRKHFDFGHTWEFYDAYEVLAVRALRQRLGLAVPEVDHPLAATWLAQPQAPSAPLHDELVTAVTQRARSLLPQWDLAGSDFAPA